MRERITFATIDSPIGPLLLATTEKGLCFIEFGKGEEATGAFLKWCRKWFPHLTPVYDEESLTIVKNQLEEYFTNQRDQFTLTLDLFGTKFQKAVWTALTEIPFGETRSYKDIAESVGSPKAVRAVGGANNRNPIPVVVPCHRVIGTNGSLVGYGGGLGIKEFLLDLEHKRNSKVVS